MILSVSSHFSILMKKLSFGGLTSPSPSRCRALRKRKERRVCLGQPIASLVMCLQLVRSTCSGFLVKMLSKLNTGLKALKETIKITIDLPTGGACMMGWLY